MTRLHSPVNGRTTMCFFRCPNDLLAVLDAGGQRSNMARSTFIVEALRQFTKTPRPPIKLTPEEPKSEEIPS